MTAATPAMASSASVLTTRSSTPCDNTKQSRSQLSATLSTSAIPSRSRRGQLALVPVLQRLARRPCRGSRRCSAASSALSGLHVLQRRLDRDEQLLGRDAARRVRRRTARSLSVRRISRAGFSAGRAGEEVAGTGDDTAGRGERQRRPRLGVGAGARRRASRRRRRRECGGSAPPGSARRSWGARRRSCAPSG